MPNCEKPTCILTLLWQHHPCFVLTKWLITFYRNKLKFDWLIRMVHYEEPSLLSRVQAAIFMIITITISNISFCNETSPSFVKLTSSLKYLCRYQLVFHMKQWCINPSNTGMTVCKAKMYRLSDTCFSGMWFALRHGCSPLFTLHPVLAVS